MDNKELTVVASMYSFFYVLFSVVEPLMVIFFRFCCCPVRWYAMLCTTTGCEAREMASGGSLIACSSLSW